MKTKNRLELTDSILSSVTKMSEGNPGCINVLMTLMKESSSIDPDDFLGPLGPMFNLDSLGIYGSNVWTLCKYTCQQDLVSMVGLLRAWQLGFVDEKTIVEASKATRYGESVITPEKLKDLVDQVKKHLPDFGKQEKLEGTQA